MNTMLLQSILKLFDKFEKSMINYLEDI